jgi:hypothetical protein
LVPFWPSPNITKLAWEASAARGCPNRAKSDHRASLRIRFHPFLNSCARFGFTGSLIWQDASIDVLKTGAAAAEIALSAKLGDVRF